MKNAYLTENVFSLIFLSWIYIFKWDRLWKSYKGFWYFIL